jgi:hypothetical protein
MKRDGDHIGKGAVAGVQMRPSTELERSWNREEYLFKTGIDKIPIQVENKGRLNKSPKEEIVALMREGEIGDLETETMIVSLSYFCDL